MKLELKHIAHYLPFEVKCVSDNGYFYTVKCESDSAEEISVRRLLSSRLLKLALRPLSDLTKEIEVNGKKFVPMVKLLKEQMTIETSHNIRTTAKYDVVKYENVSFQYSGTKYYTITYAEQYTNAITKIYKLMYDDQFYRFTLREESPESRFAGMSYKNLDALIIEWHFDVFGLIEKGLAIDINTL